MKDLNWPRQVPLQVDYAGPTRRPGTTARIVERLDETAALQLLSEAPYGRAVFVRDCEPEIRPLSHLVDGGQVIVRTRLGAALSDALAADGEVRVMFEADDLDVEARLGWSVIVSGVAAPVADPHRRDRYRQILKTMLAETEDTVIAIQPKTVTGIRIVPGEAGIPHQH